MRKIRAKERKGAGNIYCPYCRPEKVNAVWRLTGMIDLCTDVACEKHKHLMREYFDNHMTEADYQTWYRL